MHRASPKPLSDRVIERPSDRAIEQGCTLHMLFQNSTSALLTIFRFSTFGVLPSGRPSVKRARGANIRDTSLPSKESRAYRDVKPRKIGTLTERCMTDKSSSCRASESRKTSTHQHTNTPSSERAVRTSQVHFVIAVNTKHPASNDLRS